jgi:hypothetical protein
MENIIPMKIESCFNEDMELTKLLDHKGCIFCNYTVSCHLKKHGFYTPIILYYDGKNKNTTIDGLIDFFLVKRKGIFSKDIKLEEIKKVLTYHLKNHIPKMWYATIKIQNNNDNIRSKLHKYIMEQFEKEEFKRANIITNDLSTAFKIYFKSLDFYMKNFQVINEYRF